MPNQTQQETQSFFSALSEQEKTDFREWGDLFSFSNNKPPDGMEIGTVVMPTGDWFDRLRPSIDLFRASYEKQTHKPHMVITGANSFNVDHVGASSLNIVDHLQSLNIPKEEKERIIAEGQAQNTGEQAKYVYEMIQSGQITGPLVFVVSAYHLPRMYLTMVKTIMKNEGKNLNTRVYAIPVHKNWKGEIPKEPDKIRREQIIPEVDRIHRYRAKGDVATKEEVEKYVEWLNAQTDIL